MPPIQNTPPMSELSKRQAGWIAGGFLSMFATMAGQTVFIALFGASIRGEFEISAGQYGLVYTAATLGSAICLVFLGPLADKLSARVIAVACLLGLAVASIVMAYSNSIFLLMIALFGLRLCGQGMLAHNTVTALARWFNRFRGRALAISQFGYSAGEALLPLAVTLGIAAMGWRNVWLVVALILAVVLAPMIGLLFGGQARPQTVADLAINETGKVGGSWNRHRAIRDPLFWIILTGVVAHSGIVTATFFHQASLIFAKNWNPLLFASSFPILSVTSAVAGIAAGTFIDRLGAWRMLPFFLLPLCAANLTLWAGSGEWTIPLFFLLTGVSGGMIGSGVNVLWAEIYGTAHLGAIRSMATAGLVLASAAGPGLAGVLIDAGITLQTQSLYFALYCATASAVYFVIRERIGQRVRETAAI